MNPSLTAKNILNFKQIKNHFWNLRKFQFQKWVEILTSNLCSYTVCSVVII